MSLTRTLVIALVAVLPFAPGVKAAHLNEPRLTLPLEPNGPPRVALTLDACTGKADNRILDALIANRIPVTIFATARWLKRNEAAMLVIKAHPELFEIENHGAKHQPAVDVPMQVFGIAAAGSAEAVQVEVTAGGDAVTRADGHRPTWFRGATGMYTASAEQLIVKLNYRIAGYSLRADDGASLGEAATAKRIEHAKDGDVIIAHVNQPTKPAGAGVVTGILALKAKGYRFVRLEDVFSPHAAKVALHGTLPTTP